MKIIKEDKNIKMIKEIPFGGVFEVNGEQFIRVDDRFDFLCDSMNYYSVNVKTGVLHSFIYENIKVKEIKESDDEVRYIDTLEPGTVFEYEGKYYVKMKKDMGEDCDYIVKAFDIEDNVIMGFDVDDGVKIVDSEIIVRD